MVPPVVIPLDAGRSIGKNLLLCVVRIGEGVMPVKEIVFDSRMK